MQINFLYLHHFYSCSKGQGYFYKISCTSKRSVVMRVQIEARGSQEYIKRIILTFCKNYSRENYINLEGNSLKLDFVLENSIPILETVCKEGGRIDKFEIVSKESDSNKQETNDSQETIEEEQNSEPYAHSEPQPTEEPVSKEIISGEAVAEKFEKVISTETEVLDETERLPEEIKQMFKTSFSYDEVIEKLLDYFLINEEKREAVALIFESIAYLKDISWKNMREYVKRNGITIGESYNITFSQAIKKRMPLMTFNTFFEALKDCKDRYDLQLFALPVSKLPEIRIILHSEKRPSEKIYDIVREIGFNTKTARVIMKVLDEPTAEKTYEERIRIIEELKKYLSQKGITKPIKSEEFLRFLRAIK